MNIGFIDNARFRQLVKMKVNSLTSQFLRDFRSDGIAATKLVSVPDFLALRKFTRDWIQKAIQSVCTEHRLGKFPSKLSTYHKWSDKVAAPHGEIFRAAARFVVPPQAISQVLLGKRFNNIIGNLGINEWELVDEGYGWLGYRIVRPGYGDGYPLSCKDWGASSGVVSFWIPMFGFGKTYALHYVTGSHLMQYKSYLPADSKFTKGEYRLDPLEEVKVESRFVAPSHSLIYSSSLLHTENIESGRKTRINLEFRIKPLG